MNVPDDVLSQESWEEIFSKLDYRQLHQMRADITARMNEMRDTGITALRATIAEQAQILGVDLKDLVPKKTRKKRRSKDDEDGVSTHRVFCPLAACLRWPLRVLVTILSRRDCTRSRRHRRAPSDAGSISIPLV